MINWNATGHFWGKSSIISDVTILRQMVHKTNIWGGQDFETEIMSGKMICGDKVT